MASSARFSGINPQVFSNLRGQLSSLGIELRGEAGKISSKGVSAEYHYDPSTETLSINNMKVGFPASLAMNEDKIMQKLTEAVQGSGGQRLA